MNGICNSHLGCVLLAVLERKKGPNSLVFRQLEGKTTFFQPCHKYCEQIAAKFCIGNFPQGVPRLSNSSNFAWFSFFLSWSHWLCWLAKLYDKQHCPLLVYLDYARWGFTGMCITVPWEYISHCGYTWRGKIVNTRFFLISVDFAAAKFLPWNQVR